jgi:cytochrome c peroxidase
MTRPGRALWSLSGLLSLAFALSGADWDWQLPQGFPRPRVPEDNSMAAAKVELGRHLFYDKRMSVNGKESCACFRQLSWAHFGI